MGFPIKHNSRTIFTEKEFFVSSKHPSLANESHEKASNILKATLYLLAHLIMAPVRIQFDVPVVITSGFRSVKLNNALRRAGYSAAQRSLHSLGIACDFTVTNKRLLPFIYNYIKDELPYGELILYMKKGMPDRIHVSLSNGRKFAKVKEE
jgi:uncharacterized protein YcbK (DUF882 family)